MVNKSAILMGLLRGQLLITAKLIFETSNSPTDIGEQSPFCVKKRLANSRHPLLLRRDFERLTETPISEQIFRYSSTTRRLREAESSPSTAYSLNHL